MTAASDNSQWASKIKIDSGCQPILHIEILRASATVEGAAA